MDNDKQIKDKYKEYHETDEIGRKRISKEIDEIETSNDLDYDFYPEYSDKDFIYNISRRLEFFHLKSLEIPTYNSIFHYIKNIVCLK